MSCGCSASLSLSLLSFVHADTTTAPSALHYRPFGLSMPLDVVAAAKRCFEAVVGPCFASFFAMIALSSASAAHHAQPPLLHQHSLDAEPVTEHPTIQSASSASSAASTSTPVPAGSEDASVDKMLTANPAPVTIPPTTPTPVHSHGSKASKRPKLSLQTSCLPVTFGKSTTALSMNLTANCTSSPTVRNTFNNAYDTFRGSLAQPTTASPSSKQPPVRSGSALAFNNNDGDYTVPYQLPLGVRSILRNSPLAAAPYSRRPSYAGPGARKKLFRAKKRVTYRCPLEEEIKTVRFVARHSDLLSENSDKDVSIPDTASVSSDDEDEDSDSSQSTAHSGSSPSDSDARDTADETDAAQRPPRRRKRKYQRSERQVLAAGLRDGLIDATPDMETPKTPVQRRSKRPRQWRWTLGPVKDGYVQEVSESTDSPTTDSNDLSPVTPVAPRGCGPTPLLTLNTLVGHDGPRPREVPLLRSSECS